MRTTIGSKASIVVLAVTAIVVGATVANAITSASLDPVWMAGWLPAVLVGALYGPQSGGKCSGGTLRRRRS